MHGRSGKAWWFGLAWFALVWVVVPGGLFWLGYTFVGPRVGNVPGIRSKMDSVAGTLANVAPKKTDDAVKPSSVAPKVEISVSKSTKPPIRVERPRPRRRSRPKPDAPKPAAPRDEASVDGTVDQSAGGTPPSEPPTSTEGG